jgi:hypothetical protein
MATKISDVMLKIQVIKNIVLFPITPSLKNVVASSSNEKEEAQQKPTNFHNVPKFHLLSTTIIQVLMLP